MGALNDDRMQLEQLELPADEITRKRKDAEQVLGTKIPVSPVEKAAYEREGKEPPTL
jgi:hypothetical protein